VLEIEKAVNELIKRKALHKKKRVRMSEETWAELFNHLYEEMDELETAIENPREINHADQQAAKLEELGDLLGLLTHAVVKCGFTMEQVEQRELLKLKERFE
jgi:predicted house-cleaning noncanonical NTP pyrophosphatase (MazG superfamily)